MNKGILHLFPGQGIQKVGMHLPIANNPLYHQLVTTIPKLQEYIEQGPQEMLNQTEYAQPAIFICSYLNYRPQHTIAQSYAIGHSVGEYAALTASGCIDPLNTIQLLHTRGNIMRDCSKGRTMGMLAVNSIVDYSQLIAGTKKSNQIVEPALYNSETQTVYSGDKESLQIFKGELRKLKVTSLFLEVSAAFHCSLLTPGKEQLRKELQRYVNYNDKSDLIVLRNIDGQPYKSTQDIIEGLTEQLDHPVQFLKSINSIRSLQLLPQEYGSTVLSKLL